MAAPQETRTIVPKELSFYGEGKAESIKRGFAIVSLRNPRPDYKFERGEHILANCKDDGEKVPVVVIANDQQPLITMSIPILALDGCFSTEDAVEMLKPYPGYEKTTSKSPMQAIAFVHEDAFSALTAEQQKKLTTTWLRDTLHVMNNREFRHLFFPTMAYWLTERGMGIIDWSNFLNHYSMVSRLEAERIKNFEIEEGTKWASLFGNTPEVLHEIALDPTNDNFKPLILGKFDDPIPDNVS